MRTKKQRQREFEKYEADLQEKFTGGSSRHDRLWWATCTLTCSIDAVQICAGALKSHVRLGCMVRKYTYNTAAIMDQARHLHWLAKALLREVRTLQKHQAHRSALIRYARRGPRALLPAKGEVAA